MIRSHSLHKSNIVFVFQDKNFVAPENGNFVELFGGDESKGIQLVDDPVMRMKVLDVPQLNLQVAWEGSRLRVEDLGASEPANSRLLDEGARICEKLFLERGVRLEGMGFNLEVYYQSSEVIRIQDLFRKTLAEPMEIGEGLLNFGWQWTVAHKNGKQLDGYFIKITAPLEFVIHHNAHFNIQEIPKSDELKRLFKACYETTHHIASMLQL